MHEELTDSLSPASPSASDRPQAWPFIVLCSFVIASGIVLRFWDLGYPEQLTFDEHHFVKNARNYLRHKADWNDHPPLGKLLISFSMTLGQDNSFFFRLPSALLGCLSLLFGGLLASRLFRSLSAGLLAASFLAADGFLIAYSRTALLDGMLTSLSLGALYLGARADGISLFASSLLVGAAMSTKLSGITLLGPLCGLLLLRALQARFQLPALGRSFLGECGNSAWKWLVAACALPALSVFFYLLVWRYGLSLSHAPSTFAAAIDATREMIAHHSVLTERSHPLVTPWWEWVVPTRPITLYQQSLGDGMQRTVTSMGNPLLWWTVASGWVLTLFLIPLLFVSERIRRSLVPWSPLWRYQAEKVWLAIAFLAYIFPWMVSSRDSYFYHYLPAYGIGLVLAAGYLASSKPTSRLVPLAYLSCVCLLSAFYAPVWTKTPIADEMAALRVLPGHR